MSRPNKAMRKIMAGLVMKAAKEAGLELVLNGAWVEVRPANKASASMILDLSKCSNEVAEILKKREEA